MSGMVTHIYNPITPLMKCEAETGERLEKLTPKVILLSPHAGLHTHIQNKNSGRYHRSP